MSAAPVVAAGWSAQVRRDDGALGALAEEWDELHRRCRTATPFQTHAWVQSWWRQYGTPGRLRVVTVRRDGRLVAAAALLLRRRGCWSVLGPVGAGISDLTDVLLDDSCADRAAELLSGALRDEPGWHAVDLPEVPPESAAALLPGRRALFPASTCLEHPAGPIEDLLADLPGRSAHTVRKKLRKIARSGVEARVAAGDEVPEAVADLVRLHELQWRGRGVNREHLRPRFRRHLSDALQRMVAAGQAVVTRFSVEGQVLALDVVLLGRDHAGAYLYAIHPELRQRIDVYTLLLRNALATASGRGLATLSQYRGAEPHKERFRPVHRRNTRLVLARPGAMGRGYLLAVGAQTSAVRFVRERVPAARKLARWIRSRRG